jgi:hypothetical protein
MFNWHPAASYNLYVQAELAFSAFPAAFSVCLRFS